MHKMWLVAQHEYLRMVRRRSFLIGTLGIPVLIAVVMGISVMFAIGSADTRPIGYVDLSGTLHAGRSSSTAQGPRQVEMRAFPDLESASVALQAQEIQAYYIIHPGYGRGQGQPEQIELYYWDQPPGPLAQEQFRDIVQASLVTGLPDDVRQRVLAGSEVMIRSADGKRELARENFVAFLLPFAAGVLFGVAVLSSAGYLLQAVTTEKENRTMEVMATSLTPEQLISGKALGLIAVSLTQLLIWGTTLIAGLAVGAQFTPVLRGARVPWELLGIIAAYFLPAYTLVGGIMTAIGSAVTDMRQGQQIAGVVNLSFSLPFFFVAVIVANPNSALITGLTLFPTTAFLTVMFRWTFTVIPLWQLVCSWLLLVAAAVLSVWVSARILRIGMLRYGQSLSLRAILRAIRAQEAMKGKRHA